jgi:uncharacterized protein (DUF58 family)
LKFLDPRALRKLENLRLAARGVVEGFISGLHKSPFHGFSVEFSEYRKYAPGDDLKHFDWKAYAKTDKSYIKQYEEETNLKAYLLLDVSASMGYGSEGLTKLEYGCYLAASIAHLLVRQQDSVGLVTFHREIDGFLPPRSGPMHLRDLLTVLEAQEPRETTGIARAFHDLAERTKRRGLIVVISDLLDDPAEMLSGLAHFRQKKHEVIVFHVMDPHETEFPFDGMTTFRDLETSVRLQVLPSMIREDYLRLLEEHVSTFRRGCSERRIEYVKTDTRMPYELLLASFLRKRMRAS